MHRAINNLGLRRTFTWLFFPLFCFLLSFFAASVCVAKEDNPTDQFMAYLLQEKTNLTIATHEKSQPSIPSSIDDLRSKKKQNLASRALIEATIASLERFRIYQLKQQQNLYQTLKKIQQAPMDKVEGLVIQEKITNVNMKIEVNAKTIELIQDNLALARRYQESLVAEGRVLDVWQAKWDEQRKIDGLRDKINALKTTLNDFYQKNLQLQQKQTSETSLTNEALLVLNNQAITLLHYQITALVLQKKLIKADYLLVKNQDIKTLQAVTETYKDAIHQLMAMAGSLKKMKATSKNERPFIRGENLDQQWLAIQKAVSARLQQVLVMQKQLEEALDQKELLLKKQLSMRQSLAEYRLNSWPSIVGQLLSMPSKGYNYLQSLVFKVKDNYAWQDPWLAVFTWVSVLLLAAVGFSLSRLLSWVMQEKERSRLSAHLYDGLLVLLYRNIPQITVLAILMVVLFLNHVPYPNYRLLTDLLFVWLMFRTLILMARLILLERISDASGQDVRLYYRLKWLFIVGGWTTALMLFSHELPLSLLLQDLFNRLFMLFLLAISGVLWKSKDVIPYLLRPFLRTKKRYLRHAIALLAVLVPLLLFTTAVIGLIGYIHMAWTLGLYQAYLLMVMTTYILVRGLIFDALELLSEWMISALHNGWLWTEVILKPLDKLLRVFLVIVSILIVFQLFGWYSDALMMAHLQQFGHYPLVNVSGVHITFISILEFVLLVFVFIWASKWTRECCYRWLYRDVRDAGIRNSFSVFTQYAVILIGSFITLRVLGLDFSGMSMVIGGLAVGMGFGLRDFANNIVGGLTLLIERPVREGDLITLGDYEGRVAHIGIRSMRVSSWDNMEVLIPNAETFNKPFTNWTHQDSVVRTVVPIKVSRADDPCMVQQLIEEVLAIIPEILTNPAPQVFLKQIDEALIEFEVRYFINVQLHTRFEIRSKVLFAIMAQFKAASIKPPIPPLNVELIEGEGPCSG